MFTFFPNGSEKSEWIMLYSENPLFIALKKKKFKRKHLESKFFTIIVFFIGGNL
jgi:hypothetical protein